MIISWVFVIPLLNNPAFVITEQFTFNKYDISELMFPLIYCRPLRGFDLVKDRDTGNSKGYGFCMYKVCTFVGRILVLER